MTGLMQNHHKADHWADTGNEASTYVLRQHPAFSILESFLCQAFLSKKLMETTLPFPSSLTVSFNTAREEFLHDFPNDEYAQTLCQYTSIDDVYNDTDEIQKEQGESQMLQNLAKIQPYLGCLDQYATVLDTFIQVKTRNPGIDLGMDVCFKCSTCYVSCRI